MSRTPDITKTEAMFTLYQQGFSLERVGEAFGVSRQAVFERFSRRKKTLREKQHLPFIIFNNHKYTRRTSGGGKDYYRKTYGDRESLHRAVWMFHHGPIPKGYDVHHKIEDLATTEVTYLDCMPKTEHGRLESIGINQNTPVAERIRRTMEHRQRKANQ